MSQPSVNVMAAKPEGGRCKVCGCTDAWACAGGCYWIDSSHTLCSACVSENEIMRRDPACGCTWEHGDSDCSVHPACEQCGVLTKPAVACECPTATVRRTT